MANLRVRGMARRRLLPDVAWLCIRAATRSSVEGRASSSCPRKPIGVTAMTPRRDSRTPSTLSSEPPPPRLPTRRRTRFRLKRPRMILASVGTSVVLGALVATSLNMLPLKETGRARVVASDHLPVFDDPRFAVQQVDLAGAARPFNEAQAWIANVTEGRFPGGKILQASTTAVECLNTHDRLEMMGYIDRDHRWSFSVFAVLDTRGLTDARVQRCLAVKFLPQRIAQRASPETRDAREPQLEPCVNARSDGPFRMAWFGSTDWMCDVLEGRQGPSPRPPAATKATVLQLGDRGRPVLELQRELKGLGYDLDTDGVFGPRTREIVRCFQRREEVHGGDDGVVGPRTRAELEAATPIQRPIAC